MVQSTVSQAIEIREARASDLPAIVALLADDQLGRGREEVSDPLPDAYLQAFREMTEQHGNLVLVAESGNRVIGCLQLTMIAGLSRRGMKRGQIEGVRVAASQRSRGIGERLIRHAIDIARREGCGLVQLTTDKLRPDAHRFYEALGFVGSHIGMKLTLD
jgi:ribosomal protein S18 acetylase RimI-like enzyme